MNFSRASGLDSDDIQSFLLSGNVTPTLWNEIAKPHAFEGNSSDSRSTKQLHILAIRSWRTPGCLALEALDALSLALCFQAPHTTSAPCPDDYPWLTFMSDLLLVCPSSLLRFHFRRFVELVVTKGIDVAELLMPSSAAPSNSHDGSVVWSGKAAEFSIQYLVKTVEVSLGYHSAHPLIFSYHAPTTL